MKVFVIAKFFLVSARMGKGPDCTVLLNWPPGLFKQKKSLRVFIRDQYQYLN